MGLNSDRVIVVTGATRGVGKGIALALAKGGATVYVTGRSQREGEYSPDLTGTVFETAAEIDRRGGHGVPVVCDHGDPAQIAALFGRVRDDHGRLDILVNNAFAQVDKQPDKAGFWEQPLDELKMLDVGLRSNYLGAYYAAPLMVANGEGLIVQTSSPGGRVYILGPAYGAAKAGSDKIVHDAAVDLKPFNVAVVSIWMGLVRTERAARDIAADPDGLGAMYENSESAEYTGLLVDALARDPRLMERSGGIFWGAELGEEYGVTDVDGAMPASNRGFLGPTTEFGDAVLF